MFCSKHYDINDSSNSLVGESNFLGFEPVTFGLLEQIFNRWATTL